MHCNVAFMLKACFLFTWSIQLSMKCHGCFLFRFLSSLAGHNGSLHHQFSAIDTFMDIHILGLSPAL